MGLRSERHLQLFGRRTNGVYAPSTASTISSNGIVQPLSAVIIPGGGNVDNMAADWGLTSASSCRTAGRSIHANLTMTYGFRVDIPNVSRKPTYNQAAWRPLASATMPPSTVTSWCSRVWFQLHLRFRASDPAAWCMGLFRAACGCPTPYSNTGLQYTDYFFSRWYQHLAELRTISWQPAHAGYRRDLPVGRFHRPGSQPRPWKANRLSDR